MGENYFVSKLSNLAPNTERTPFENTILALFLVIRNSNVSQMWQDPSVWQDPSSLPRVFWQYENNGFGYGEWSFLVNGILAKFADIIGRVRLRLPQFTGTNICPPLWGRIQVGLKERKRGIK